MHSEKRSIKIYHNGLRVSEKELLSVKSFSLSKLNESFTMPLLSMTISHIHDRHPLGANIYSLSVNYAFSLPFCIEYTSISWRCMLGFCKKAIVHMIMSRLCIDHTTDAYPLVCVCRNHDVPW